MNITKAVITAASPSQRKLPLQTIIDIDGNEKSVLNVLIQEVKSAGIKEVGIIVSPGDEVTYRDVITEHDIDVQFIVQENPLGYGNALLQAKSFVNQSSFLHLVGDHLYVQREGERCAKQVIEIAKKHNCAVSAVQATRESLIPYFGVIGGQRISGSSDLYKIEKVMEKPSPTIAEKHLIIPGLRAGYYLCFFGMHVLTPTFYDILEKQIKANPNQKLSISAALNELASKEQYLAMEKTDMRFDVGTKYGLLKAQVALALAGKDRDRVMSELLELFTMREVQHKGK